MTTSNIGDAIERVRRARERSCDGWITVHDEDRNALLAHINAITAERDAYKTGQRLAMDQMRVSGQSLTAERDAARAEVARLRDVSTALIDACDKGRPAPRPGCGVGGMTVEANIRASVINGVSAWAVEEARAALSAPATEGDSK